MTKVNWAFFNALLILDILLDILPSLKTSTSLMLSALPLGTILNSGTFTLAGQLDAGGFQLSYCISF